MDVWYCSFLRVFVCLLIVVSGLSIRVRCCLCLMLYIIVVGFALFVWLVRWVFSSWLSSLCLAVFVWFVLLLVVFFFSFLYGWSLVDELFFFALIVF